MRVFTKRSRLSDSKGQSILLRILIRNIIVIYLFQPAEMSKFVSSILKIDMLKRHLVWNEGWVELNWSTFIGSLFFNISETYEELDLEEVFPTFWSSTFLVLNRSPQGYPHTHTLTHWAIDKQTQGAGSATRPNEAATWDRFHLLSI